MGESLRGCVVAWLKGFIVILGFARIEIALWFEDEVHVFVVDGPRVYSPEWSRPE